MTDMGKTLTTTEYSKITGIPVSTLGKMLRQGKLKGEKRGGKWAIFESELPTHAAVTGQNPTHASSIPESTDIPPENRASAYDLDTFVQMTYLTEKGVLQWLKNGRLSGRVTDGGTIVVDAANLDRPELKHLIRK